jgi:DNA-binding Lrp family transcriptional regulator
MLREMLALLSEGKTVSQYDLAERLNATPETITARLDFLHRAGYLRKICAVSDCGKRCHGCMGCGPIPACYVGNFMSKRIYSNNRLIFRNFSGTDADSGLFSEN